jgi:hypothetical protein
LQAGPLGLPPFPAVLIAITSAMRAIDRGISTITIPTEFLRSLSPAHPLP